MRPTLLNHQKFKRLCAILKAPKPHVVGYLELLWNSAYESGDPRIGDSFDVELACEWEGEAGVLTDALESCGGPGRHGFVDEDGGVYTIHDLYDHAPEYVQKRAKREAARREKGQTISDMRRSAAEKRWQTDANGGRLHDTCIQTAASDRQSDAKVCTPTPTPTPTPTHKNKNPPLPPQGGTRAKSKRATQMPDDWIPSVRHKELAIELGVDLQREEEHFRDYCLANGKTYKDWDAGFRTWLRNAKTFKRGPQNDGLTKGQREFNAQMDFLKDEMRKCEEGNDR